MRKVTARLGALCFAVAQPALSQYLRARIGRPHRVSRCRTSNPEAIRLLRRDHPLRRGNPMIHQSLRFAWPASSRSTYRNLNISPNVFARHWLGGLPSQWLYVP